MNPTTVRHFTITKWTKASFAGWLLGIVVILMLSSLLDAVGIEHMQFYLGVGMGAGVGVIQWLYLRKIIPIGKTWIWYSIIGLGTPFVALDLIPNRLLPNKLPIAISMGSLAVGFLQYTILKPHSPKAKRWILACCIAWILAVAIVFTVDYTKTLKPFVTSNLILAAINLLLILFGGIVLGITSGLTMARIVKR